MKKKTNPFSTTSNAKVIKTNVITLALDVAILELRNKSDNIRRYNLVLQYTTSIINDLKIRQYVGNL